MIWSNDTLPCVHGPLQGLADLLEIHYIFLLLLHLLLVDVVLCIVHVVVDIAVCRGTGFIGDLESLPQLSPMLLLMLSTLLVLMMMLLILMMILLILLGPIISIRFKVGRSLTCY